MQRDMTCPCQYVGNEDKSFDGFLKLRKNCLALNKFFIPDHQLREFLTTRNCIQTNKNFDSIIYLAYQDNYLQNLTLPIHKFLITNGQLHQDLKNQYKSDANEHWMKKRTVKDIARNTGIYLGKISELLFAYWLDTQGWSIDKLEALNYKDKKCEHDVLAKSPSNENYAFEIKRIHIDIDIFSDGNKCICAENVLNIFKNGGFYDSYKYSDYTLLIILSAARQFKINNKFIKVDVIIIDGNMYDFYKFHLKNNFQWENGMFYDLNRDFLDQKKISEYKIQNPDCKHLLQPLQEVWIVKESPIYKYEIVKKLLI